MVKGYRRTSKRSGQTCLYYALREGGQDREVGLEKKVLTNPC